MKRIGFLYAVFLVAVCCASIGRPANRPVIIRPDSVAQQTERNALMRFDPPAIYSVWWTQVERCLGLTRPIEDVSFYVVKTPTFTLRYDDGSVSPEVLGNFNEVTNQILLGLGMESLPWVVRHEMAHAIMYGNHGTHPDAVFGAAAPCARLVRDPSLPAP